MSEQKKPSLSQYFGANSLEEGGKLMEYLVEPLFTTGDLGISRRNINYWDNNGLLISTRAEGDTWRSYSFIEYTWLKIVEELRRLGCPLETIRHLKTGLFQDIPAIDAYQFLQQNPQFINKNLKEKEEFTRMLSTADFSDPKLIAELSKIEFSLLQMMIAEAIAHRVHLALAVFFQWLYDTHLYGRGTSIHRRRFKPYFIWLLHSYFPFDDSVEFHLG